MDQSGPRAQQRDGIWAGYPTAAWRQDGRCGRRELSSQLMLQFAKCRLAVLTNNSRDWAACAALDLSVEVQEWEVQALGHEWSDGAFASARKPDENEVTVHLSRWAI
jgi:hypothetical protein